MCSSSALAKWLIASKYDSIGSKLKWFEKAKCLELETKKLSSLIAGETYTFCTTIIWVVSNRRQLSTIACNIVFDEKYLLVFSICLFFSYCLLFSFQGTQNSDLCSSAMIAIAFFCFALQLCRHQSKRHMRTTCSISLLSLWMGNVEHTYRVGCSIWCRQRIHRIDSSAIEWIAYYVFRFQKPIMCSREIRSEPFEMIFA